MNIISGEMMTILQNNSCLYKIKAVNKPSKIEKIWQILRFQSHDYSLAECTRFIATGFAIHYKIGISWDLEKSDRYIS